MLKLESLNGQIKRLTLKSPIVGTVEEILVERGETIQAMSPVARLVQIDPLVINLPVPVNQAVELKIGQIGMVTFLDATELTGKITHIASIADAAATTLAVTLQVDNKDRRPAGERAADGRLVALQPGGEKLRVARLDEGDTVMTPHLALICIHNPYG